MSAVVRPTRSMIAAVKAVAPSQRLVAAQVAERTFLARLATLTAWDDYRASANRELAGDAAAAEVAFRFPSCRRA